MNIQNFFQEKRNKKILCAIGTVIAALVIFQAGIFVGYHKAAYSFGWGERYYKTFGERGGHERGHRGMMGFGRMGEGLSNSHGAVGKIISIALPTIIIEDRGGIEKTIALTEDTVIMSFRNKVEVGNLKIGDSVVVIGAPNKQTLIEARLIRIIPDTVPQQL
jgi:hypothetical protein